MWCPFAVQAFISNDQFRGHTPRLCLMLDRRHIWRSPLWHGPKPTTTHETRRLTCPTVGLPLLAVLNLGRRTRSGTTAMSACHARRRSLALRRMAGRHASAALVAETIRADRHSSMPSISANVADTAFALLPMWSLSSHAKPKRTLSRAVDLGDARFFSARSVRCGPGTTTESKLRIQAAANATSNAAIQKVPSSSQVTFDPRGAQPVTLTDVPRY